MPHRRCLGEKAVDQRAESALGRMVLRGELSQEEGRAGELYARDWRAYIASVNAPKALCVGSGRQACADCDAAKVGEDQCLCEWRKRRWFNVRTALADSGATRVVDAVCLVHELDPCTRIAMWLLKTGLSALAQHYGLTGRKNGVLGKSRT